MQKGLLEHNKADLAYLYQGMAHLEAPKYPILLQFSASTSVSAGLISKAKVRFGLLSLGSKASSLILSILPDHILQTFLESRLEAQLSRD